ncbi:MAG: TlpA family protein disulfide reductase [Oscillospiraceae bacterium]|nr:TlpA family protein disulfide reductase [Oscillospiraceae bacterium]
MKKLIIPLAVICVLLCVVLAWGGAEQPKPQPQPSQAAATTPKPAAKEAVSPATYGTVDLNAEDMDFQPFVLEEQTGAKLVLLNFWEPWCGPCVREMPDLQKLQEAYKDKGLLVIGVYSAFNQDSEVKKLVAEKGITYPILRCNDHLAQLQQDYVPASYFADAEGNLLSAEPIVGAQSYEQWESMVQEFLNEMQ